METDVRFGDFMIRTWLINDAVAGFEVLRPYSFSYTRDGIDLQVSAPSE